MLRTLLIAGISAYSIASVAQAQAIIEDGGVILGVDEFGQLNIPGGDASPFEGTTAVGLRHAASGTESTSHGCLCEGWGVGIGETGVSGSANNDDGVDDLDLVSFTSTATTAVSVADLSSGELQVTHSFALASETDDLFAVSVSIENTSGADIADLRYTRTFDWDIEPDTFDELVTHSGTQTTTSLLASIGNGFVNSDPFASRSETTAFDTDTVDFEDFGPDDFGSNFDFGFGALAAGETFDFTIYYGASDTEAGALAALGEVGAELFSLGQAASDPLGTGVTDGSTGLADGTVTPTFIFGFSGVGGTIIIPDPTPDPDPNPSAVPVPASALLILSGLGGLGLMRRRKSQKAS